MTDPPPFLQTNKYMYTVGDNYLQKAVDVEIINLTISDTSTAFQTNLPSLDFM